LAKESSGLIKVGFGNVVAGGINFVFMLLSIFFFLEDGPVFIQKMENFMPFSKKQREKLLNQTKDIVVSTIYGGVVVAMTQGVIGGVTFAFLGIHSPVVWGLAMFVASFIPVVGTFIVWGPMVIYLFFEAQYARAIILILVGLLAISSVDNILRPLIIRGKMKMPTVAIFFSILGGIKLFGFIGFIMGPLVLALFVSVFDIFRYSEEER
jgi:predicted PurR-regulated permease PerM